MKCINNVNVQGLKTISQKAQYKDVYRRTIVNPQRACIVKANYSLKVQNAHLKLASPISG